MKVVFAVLLLAATAYARPQFLGSLAGSAGSAASYITEYTNDESNKANGEYSYNVETSDGQLRGETRRVINPGTDQEKAIVEGYYSYIGPDGERYTVGYKADDEGYQPEGEHLPPSADVKRRPPQVGIPPNAVKSLQG